jgi:anti-sigma factor RsiW
VSDAHDHQGRDRRTFRIAGLPSRPFSSTIASGHIDDLIPGYALGALEPDESAAIEAHVRGCPSCEQSLWEAERTVGVLPFTVPLHTPSMDNKVALFARVAHAHKAVVASSLPRVGGDVWRTPTLPSSAGADIAPVAPSFATASPQPRRESRTSWLVSAVSVPLLIALIATGFWGMQLRNQLSTQSAQVADLQAQLTNFGAGTTAYPLSPGAAAPQAEGQILMGADQRGGILQIDVNSKEGARDYELWVNKDGKLVPAAEVTVNQDGRGQAPFELDQPFSEYQSVHVRAKPLDGTAADGQADTLQRSSDGPLGSTGSGLDISP